nr:hypothetical protein [Parabacteroides goldsteinii]
MEIYKPLCRVTLEHDYFNDRQCSALSLRITSQGLQLARQRILLFRQTAVNEWTLLYDSTNPGVDTERDVLELALNITDPLFTLYTEWGGLHPAGPYVLQLPVKEEEMEKGNKVSIMSAICPSNEKRKLGTSFCTVRLRLTKELLEAAEAGYPKREVLHFCAPEVRWEYFFLSRSGECISPEDLSLEDITGKLKFSDFKECEIFGKTAVYTITEGSFPLRENPENHLRFVALKGERKQRQILLSRVPLPVLGRFQSGQSEIIRQICYY